MVIADSLHGDFISTTSAALEVEEPFVRVSIESLLSILSLGRRHQKGVRSVRTFEETRATHGLDVRLLECLAIIEETL